MKPFQDLTSGDNWIITKDHGVCCDCKDADAVQIRTMREEGYVKHFKMYDDDGELYYSGYAKDGADFEPLDEFGTPNAGCTAIKYRNDDTGKYEYL